jgi:hypothetical protein
VNGCSLVRPRDEQALRDAVHQLLANGYDVGRISKLALDAMGVWGLVKPGEPPSSDAVDLVDRRVAPGATREGKL